MGEKWQFIFEIFFSFSFSLFFCILVKPLLDSDVVWFLASPRAAAAGFILMHCNPLFCGPTCALCLLFAKSIRGKNQNSAGVTDI